MNLSEKDKYAISLKSDLNAWSVDIDHSYKEPPKVGGIIKLYYNKRESGIYKVISNIPPTIHLWQHYSGMWYGGHGFSPSSLWVYKTFLFDKESISPHWE